MKRWCQNRVNRLTVYRGFSCCLGKRSWVRHFLSDRQLLMRLFSCLGFVARGSSHRASGDHRPYSTYTTSHRSEDVTVFPSLIQPLRIGFKLNIGPLVIKPSGNDDGTRSKTFQRCILFECFCRCFKFKEIAVPCEFFRPCFNVL